ncbi:TetR/AcrR family transcriptional regulator [Cellulomonas chengniuliangii]|uniref:TetR/AcrR family transcriptional regulator n=1 Tax=Cellulomonas chengniuliangii TaxID=2968084 RepID=A0ABY5L5N1_9CELL|nr:TetR/AcrR family transcriptional regulator [Cellulomonas chengniuliangii]MCC2308462.1 TetR/AcrR family transcriptional regulator [Cellulomonas chengniuliangii]MCC2317479.1 TetR/AcrR family transcriptional regulator [Cellulomonas chengniuliangii]UUI76836.1 TetR/AcrR family transcriptional regulator [Cellulomonas chengniuliangii]
MPGPSVSPVENRGGAAKTRDAERTRREILDAAIEEFSERGLLGARVDAIAERIDTTKRMIYYYFGSKDGLYRSALVESYRRTREREQQLGLEAVDPEEALRTLVRSTLCHDARNEPFVRLVMFENLNNGGAIHTMDEEVRAMNQVAHTILDDILARGRASGAFRDGPDAPSALDVHQVISALAFFRTANRSTFRELFGRDMLGDESRDHVRQLVEDTVMRLVLADPR